jgi:hypothetical protein
MSNAEFPTIPEEKQKSKARRSELAVKINEAIMEAHEQCDGDGLYTMEIAYVLQDLASDYMYKDLKQIWGDD